MWRRRLRFYILKLLRLKGAPTKVAFGFALGACINFYPTFGIALILAGFLGGITRSNVPAALLGDLLFKPLFPAMFYINLVVGDNFVREKTQDLAWAFPKLLLLQSESFFVLGKVFFTGAFINSMVFGAILFSIVYKVFKDHRKRLARWFNKQRII